jgi:PadR family transcriptional regulator AphA
VTIDTERVLTAGEWAVLGVLCEAPAHGFAVARRVAETETIGQVWTMNRPAVYRAIHDLATSGLIVEAGTSQSERGPARELYAVTAEGRERLERWLAAPVEHVRDVRTLLLIKLALLFDRGEPAGSLLRAQRRVLDAILVALESALPDASGFEAVVLRYRTETARSANVFVEELLGASVS